jgi:hypothetical protein
MIIVTAIQAMFGGKGDEDWRWIGLRLGKRVGYIQHSFEEDFEIVERL